MFPETQPEKTETESERPFLGSSVPTVSTPRFSLASQKSPRFGYFQFSASSPQITRSSRPTTARYTYRMTNSRYVIPPREPDPEGDLLMNENSDEIQKLSTRILLGEAVESKDPSTWRLIIIDLMNKRNRFEEKGDLKESVHAQECIEYARNMQLEAKKEQARIHALRDLKLRKGHTETDESIFEHKYEADKLKLEMRFDDLEKQMLDRHHQERIRHDKEWMSERKNFPYMHISSKLRNFREMHDKLIKAKRYEEAHAINEEARKQEQIEQKKMQEQRAADYNRSLQNMLKRHEDELKNLRETRDAKLNLLKVKSENGETVFENRKRAIKYNEDIANDKDKLWKLKHRNDQFSNRVMDKQLKKSPRLGSIASTPRTQQQLKLPPLTTKFV